MINCAVFAIANLLGIRPDDVEQMLGVFDGHDAAKEWVERGDDGAIASVRIAEVAAALCAYLGLTLLTHRGAGPGDAAGWASMSRWLRSPLLLCVPSKQRDGAMHVLVARDGLLFDANEPDGKPAAEHPYGDSAVRLVMRLLDSGDPGPSWKTVEEIVREIDGDGGDGAPAAAPQSRGRPARHHERPSP